jgi:hypothetical protein
MNQRIIYPTDEGVAVVVPTPEYLEAHTMEQLAQSVVPAGKPFQIVDVADIPTERTFRGAWSWES